MDSVRTGCVVFLFLFSASAYEVPEVKIEVLQPKGIQASIPNTPGLTLFVFHGHINRPINEGQVGSISGEITKPQGGRWIVKNKDVKLNSDDTLNYYILIVHEGKTYKKSKLSFKGAASVKIEPKIKNPSCTPSVTKVRGSLTPTCSGEVIFEDDFEDLNLGKWQIQNYIPLTDYGYPFVSYQYPAVVASGGSLEITPMLQRDQPGYNTDKVNTGTLDLFHGCTGPENTCYMQALAWDILPPVISGKVTTKEFAFTYGIVEIRAKMPVGDWLYSELHLESFMERYGGFNKVTKILKIASTRGNLVQSDGCGNNLLYGGPIVSPKCRETVLATRNSSNNWGEDFHVYSVEWRPDMITLRVDGQEWGKVQGKIKDKLGEECEVPMGLLTGDVDMAPFDSHYFLSLGVAAGGVTEFRDGVITAGSNRKPWKNTESKAKLKFWRHQKRWTQTWNEPKMLIDYVKVTAL